MPNFFERVRNFFTGERDETPVQQQPGPVAPAPAPTRPATVQPMQQAPEPEKRGFLSRLNPFYGRQQRERELESGRAEVAERERLVAEREQQVQEQAARIEAQRKVDDDLQKAIEADRQKRGEERARRAAITQPTRQPQPAQGPLANYKPVQNFGPSGKIYTTDTSDIAMRQLEAAAIADRRVSIRVMDSSGVWHSMYADERRGKAHGTNASYLLSQMNKYGYTDFGDWCDDGCPTDANDSYEDVEDAVGYQVVVY